jgi:hypothetical protein
MTKRHVAPQDPNDQWHLHVRETYRLHIPLRDDHAWTAIAREPLASDWDGPDLGKAFPQKYLFARAVLVSVVDQGWPAVTTWREAKGDERAQLAEAVALRSEVQDLLRQGTRPASDEEQTATMRAAKELAMNVLDRLTETA